MFSEEEEAKLVEKEYGEWIEKNNFFFEKKFFPAAEYFENLSCLANSALQQQ